MRKRETFFYQEIAESLRRRIAAGEFQPGDKLPPVRDMAQQWGCTPGTVSRAYAQLAQEGLVAGYRGGGTQVAPSALQSSPQVGWATLINRAEAFLLEALSAGHTPAQAQSALSVAVARWDELRQQDAPTPTPLSASEMRFGGSHDLTIELLAQMLAEKSPAVELRVEYSGSLGGLMALARGEVDVAGTHLWDAATDSYNAPFVRRLFPGRRVTLITLVHRSLGLIVSPGNPQQVKNLTDLTHPGVRLVNRQAGSGTRVWLDAQLSKQAITPDKIAGYEREEPTHLAIAQAVERGEATVGLGIRAAAAAFDLGFVPLTQEHYELAFSETTWRSSAGQALVGVIRSPQFQEAVVALGGYDTSQTGQERVVA